MEQVGVCRVAVLTAALCGAIAGSAAAADPTLVAKWGSQGTGDGQFDVPNDLTIGSDGSVYVADGQNNRIQRFTSTGSFIGKWGTRGGGAGQFLFPRGVAADAAGNVYVADTSNHRVQKFNADGAFQLVWGSSGTAEGQFNNPESIAVDAAGNVYVGEFSGHRIQKFDSNGTFQRMWGWGVSDGSAAFQVCTGPCQGGIYGSGAGQLARPVGLAVDGAGNVYEADRDNNRVQKFSSSGAFLGQWGSSGQGDGQFSSPQDVAVDPAGNVSVADNTNYRIQKFSPAGGFMSKFTTVAPSETFRPVSVAFDSPGDIYILDGVRILRARESAAPPPGAGGLPPPVLGTTVNVSPEKGEVFVSVPAGTARASQTTTVPGLKGRRFVPLGEARQIPVGSFLDTREGLVRLDSARDAEGRTQTGYFAAGVFQVVQSRTAGAKGLTELRLKGSSFRSCRARRSSVGKAIAQAAAGRRRLPRATKRRLRAEVTGNFSTRGRHSSAAVRGTTWDTRDRCDGTLTRVKRGEVAVRDFRRRKTIIVGAGESYLARAPG